MRQSQNTLYNFIGKDYNETRRADPYLAERLFQLLAPQNEGLYLDIGCGTGNYTLALLERGYRFYGIDPSEKMLDVARQRSDKVQWVPGSAEQIPVADAMFQGATAVLTIHHWNDLVQGFREMYRVLDERGRIIILTSTPEQMEGYWLNHYFPEMMRTSIRVMPSQEMIAQAFSQSRFEISYTEKYFVQDDLQDQFLYVGKNCPELYMEEKIQKGISSFAAFSNREEVQRGLAMLRRDIDSGAFQRVKAQYENDLGDYLFIKAEKT